MKKTNLKINIISETSNINSQIEGNILEEKHEIIYQEQDELKTNVKFNYENNILIRENDNLLLKYEFIKDKVTKGLIKIKEYNKNIEIDLKTVNIKKEKNNIEIEYIIEQEKYLYTISMED